VFSDDVSSTRQHSTTGTPLKKRRRKTLTQSINQSIIFGRRQPFAKWFALCYQTVVLSVLSVCLSVCNVGVLLPNGWMDQDETWHAGSPRPWPHCVRWGPSSPPQKGAELPIFGPCLLWPNGWMVLDGSRRHLARRWASVQATLC